MQPYDCGGGVGIGLTLPYQSLPSAPLKLTAVEKKDLIAFLGTLTDTVLEPSAAALPTKLVAGRSR